MCDSLDFGPNKATVVLASASPRRSQLLKQAGINFVVRVSGFDETLVDATTGSPENAAILLATMKAGAVANQLVEEACQGCYFVIGADTMVVLGDEVFGKPKDDEHSKQMLQKLSGATHRVVTAVSVWTVCLSNGEQISCKDRSFLAQSNVSFKTLSDAEIDLYLRTGESFDKAGAYAAQGEGAKLIASIDGYRSTVIGLPIEQLLVEFPELKTCR